MYAENVSQCITFAEIKSTSGPRKIYVTYFELQVDDESPFLREVALWGVRNLCEGNLSIQHQIEQLQVLETVQSPEMQAAGIRLQHDPGTGKMNIVDGINQ